MDYLNLTNRIPEEFAGIVAGGMIGAFVGVLLIFAIILLIAFYIYFALAWSTIAKKLKHKQPWLAWIPIAQIGLILELGGINPLWLLVILVPVLGWIAIFVLTIIATWKIFEKRKYPGWLSLAPIIPRFGGILYLISIGFVAWKDQKKKQ